MDHRSPLDRSPAAAPLPSQHPTRRGSGTRRIVRHEQDSLASEMPAPSQPEPSGLRRWARRALDGCWRLDERSRGRLLGLSSAVAGASAATVPSLLSGDGLGAGRAISLSFVALGAAGFIWLARCRPKAGAWQPEHVRARVSAVLRSLRLDWRSFARAPKLLRLSIIRRWTLAAGVAGLAVSSTLGVAVQLAGRAIGPTLAGASLWGASLLLISQLSSWALRVQAPRKRPAQGDLALAAWEFAPLVDLSSPVERETLFLDPTPLHRVMAGLSSWHDAAEWRTAADNAAALQHHLWSDGLPLARLDRRRWLGAGAGAIAADLIVDDSVLIDFQIGLQRADVQQVIERVQRYRSAWGSLPIVTVLCTAGGADSLDAAALEALVAAHDASAWILVVSR